MWGATAHIVPARVLGFAQRLLLIDAPSPLNPTLFRLAFPGFWLFWGLGVLGLGVLGLVFDLILACGIPAPPQALHRVLPPQTQ